MAFIELKKVSKAFGPLVVLDGVDLAIEDGQSLVVIGASGTGKSVLLKHIVGLLRPDDGEVWFDGARIAEMPERELMEIRTRFGFLFQLGALFDSLTVGENLRVSHIDRGSEGWTVDQVCDRLPILRDRVSQPAGVISSGLPPANSGQKTQPRSGRSTVASPR